MFERHDASVDQIQSGRCLNRRHALRVAAFGLAAGAGTDLFRPAVADDLDLCRNDVAIDAASSLLFCAEAPLAPDSGLRDARAVWCHVPPRPDRSVLIYLHGHNGYVTVDDKGQSRVPDWAAGDGAARAGASSRQAAPLAYGLDRLEDRIPGKTPIVMVPEVSTLAKGSFWAKEPAGQYAQPARLGSLIADCCKHLARLRRPAGGSYLPEDFLKLSDSTRPGRRTRPALERVYLCGHSGAGLPLEEAARSTLILPDTGVPADLWLFDSTYWSNVDGFIRFCNRWHQAECLAAGRRDSARFVCIYRAKTQTEEVADILRTEIARCIGAEPQALVKDHSPDNLDKEIRPALARSGVMFVRTHVPHDEIPAFFIPVLLETPLG